MNEQSGTTHFENNGLRHSVAAAGHSIGGLKRLTQKTAFRLDAVAAFGLVIAYGVMDVGNAVRLAALVLFMALIATEAINGAIEEIVDRVSPEVSDMARYAKDLGSLAVFCLLAANSVVLVYALALQF